jgi:hypothetical protein
MHTVSNIPVGNVAVHDVEPLPCLMNQAGRISLHHADLHATRVLPAGHFARLREENDDVDGTVNLKSLFKGRQNRTSPSM